mmetsp:Transcript_77297/g.151661  ORF Transcript_77297/g.151661 Transcript_77297/m.151661 type:complete len:116 (-) Transcript_77297:174-521(-)
MGDPLDKLKKSLQEIMVNTEQTLDKRMKAAREYLVEVQRQEGQVREELETLRGVRASLEDERARVQQQLEEVAQVRAELEARKRGGFFACCMAKPKAQVADITVPVDPEQELGDD